MSVIRGVNDFVKVGSIFVSAFDIVKIGDKVTFQSGGVALRGRVTEIKHLTGGLGIAMRAHKNQRDGVALETETESQELFDGEGVYWARGWNSKDARALEARIVLERST